MKWVNYGLMALGALGFVGIMLPIGGPFGVLFMAVFCLWPYAVQIILVRSFPVAAAQAILTLTAVLYAGWFAYIYLNAMVWHPDPQSAVLFLFTGAYALPGLLPLWTLAGVLEWRIGRRP